MAKAVKYVYSWGNGKAEGKGHQKQLLGGKGAGLAEMTHIGLPVPAGMTITTECCDHYYKNNKHWPKGLEQQVKDALKKLERVCGKKVGDAKDPLLLSVRSGAAVSMPGMMETILNLGLNDRSVEGLANISGSRRFAYDAYRRFIMMYGSTAMGIERELFDEAFDHVKNTYSRPRLGVPQGRKVLDTEVNTEELITLVNRYKEIYQQHTREPFPQDPYKQLMGSVNAVFNSWMADKAVTYRRVEKISGLTGTAVNVMQMVFGNMGDDCGTGVCFTRDPNTGDNEIYGDLLMNAQGEDVVAGVRTPLKLYELKSIMPDVYDQLEAVCALLELHYKDMQDLEFTIERNKLYMLQCRTGKRSPKATFKIAVEQATKPLLTKAKADRLAKKKYLPAKYAQMAVKPIIDQRQAIMRIKGQDIERLFYPVIDPQFSRDELERRYFAEGINAVAGSACGKICLSAAKAEESAAAGENVILVRKETSPEDVGGMHAAKGILTSTGGKTSHAAVVARGWGKCCIVGCEELEVDYSTHRISVDGKSMNEGDFITLDGTSGRVYMGEMPLTFPEMPAEYQTLMSWCDRHRDIKVRTNADTPADARRAIEMGAEGIGLCRTEHMFFETEERRLAIQEMIVADHEEQRRATLNKLLPFQRQDFVGIFEAMDGKPVTIRLIDPPLHEFLPKSPEDRERLSRATGMSTESIVLRSEQLHESNPMLGHRGCRLCITYPEILEMQVTAIMEAAVECKKNGVKVLPEIMIPLTIDAKELKLLADKTREIAEGILKRSKIKVPYTVGTMIETPRAALLSGRLAEVADFFSFGTNDLTQTTMALSRDDSGRFLPDYINQAGAAILKDDPFQTLDVDGVGLLVQWGIESARRVKSGFKVGICGEHGGDPASVRFCHHAKMDYVSCSPFRVPIARLAAAQSVLQNSPAAKISKKSSGKATSTRSSTKKKTAKKTKKTTSQKGRSGTVARPNKRLSRIAARRR